MLARKFDAVTACKMLGSFVSISRFNKGEAGKIIEEVKQDGIRVIVKNNAPECVMISVEEYDNLIAESKRTLNIYHSKEEDKKRKDFINKIRKNVASPIPAQITMKDAVEKIGPIDVDEDAVNELRRISII